MSDLRDDLIFYGKSVNDLHDTIDAIFLDFLSNMNYTLTSLTGAPIVTKEGLFDELRQIYAQIYANIEAKFFEDHDRLNGLFKTLPTVQQHFQDNINDYADRKAMETALMILDTIESDLISPPALFPVSCHPSSSSNQIKNNRSHSSSTSPQTLLLREGELSDYDSTDDAAQGGEEAVNKCGEGCNQETVKDELDLFMAVSLSHDSSAEDSPSFSPIACGGSTLSPASDARLKHVCQTLVEYKTMKKCSVSREERATKIEQVLEGIESLPMMNCKFVFTKQEQYEIKAFRLVRAYAARFVSSSESCRQNEDQDQENRQRGKVPFQLICILFDFYIQLPFLKIHEIDCRKDVTEKVVNIASITNVFQNGSSLFYLTNDHKLYVEGHNDNMQLGYDCDENDRFTWSPVKFHPWFNDVRFGQVKLVSEGHSQRHGYVVTKCGKLVALGDKRHARHLYYKLKFSIVSIQCGRDHSLFLTDLGQVWCNGDKVFGVLHGARGGTAINSREMESLDTMHRLDEFSRLTVVQIACCFYSSFVLTKEGDVYTFGFNACGEAGLGQSFAKSVVAPTKIRFFGVHGLRIETIRTSGEHVGFMDREKNIYLNGNNNAGQIGVNVEKPHDKVIYYPRKLLNTHKLKTSIVNFQLGPRRTLLIDEWNNIYTLGTNIYRKHSDTKCQVRLSRSLLKERIRLICLENTNLIIQNQGMAFPI